VLVVRLSGYERDLRRVGLGHVDKLFDIWQVVWHTGPMDNVEEVEVSDVIVVTRHALRWAMETGLVVEVEVAAGFATGTVGALDGDSVRLEFDTGEPGMTVALADVLDVRVLGRQAS